MGMDNKGDITHTIITEVADEKDVDPIELEPLHSSVDLDALEDLFEKPSDVNRVEFEYSDYEIIVENEGQVHIEST